MDQPVKTKSTAPASDYLAPERTLLAWIRTGLALMGFGFVVARFGLFLREFLATQHNIQMWSFGFSLWLGVALIVVGVLVNVFVGWQHTRLVGELDRGETVHSHPCGKPWPSRSFLLLSLWL